MVKKYWVCEHDLDWFQERTADPPDKCDFQVIKLSELNELLDELMKEHKNKDHKDVCDIKKLWCKYCFALSKLKRIIGKN